MLDVFLYMCYFYWLIDEIVSVNGLAEKNQAESLNRIYIWRERERVSRVRETPCIYLRRKISAITLPSKPQPRGNVHINRNGLIQDVRAS